MRVETSAAPIAGRRVDPVESEPLFHFFPGENVLRFAVRDASPPVLAEVAVASGAGAVALPASWMGRGGDVVSAVRACRERSLHCLASVSVDDVLRRAARLADLDAVLVDLTAASHRPRPEMEAAIAAVAGLRCQASPWTELVVSLVAGVNDDDRALDALTRALVRQLGTAVPLHLVPLAVEGPATREAILHARWIAMANGLHWVYGGLPEDPTTHCSWCPGCDALLAARDGAVPELSLRDRCPTCHWPVPGCFEPRLQVAAVA